MRWIVRVGGEYVGFAEIYEKTTALPTRRPGIVDTYNLRVFLYSRYYCRYIEILACIEALAQFWSSPKTAAVPVEIHMGGWTAPVGPLSPHFISIFPGVSGYRSVTVTLRGVFAFLRKCRRALAWALVRATRQASPHPLAAFLHRNPGLLHVVGRRILGYWTPRPDPFTSHWIARVYHLQFRK